MSGNSFKLPDMPYLEFNVEYGLIVGTLAMEYWQEYSKFREFRPLGIKGDVRREGIDRAVGIGGARAVCSRVPAGHQREALRGRLVSLGVDNFPSQG